MVHNLKKIWRHTGRDNIQSLDRHVQWLIQHVHCSLGNILSNQWADKQGVLAVSSKHGKVDETRLW